MAALRSEYVMARKRARNSGDKSRWQRIGARLRGYLLAGILVTGPIAFTLWITWTVIDFIDRLVARLLPAHYDPPFAVPGVGLIVALAVLALIGWIAAGYIGRIFLRMSDRVMQHVPIISGIYTALKQIFETVLAKRSNTFREVVMVEFPHKGMWTVAFVTAKAEGELAAAAGKDSVGVYVPTTPNPTSGYLIYLPRADLIPLNMSVEDGIKLVISGGIVAPAARAPALADTAAALVTATETEQA
jgi:uncharacterized membrane protein